MADARAGTYAPEIACPMPPAASKCQPRAPCGALGQGLHAAFAHAFSSREIFRDYLDHKIPPAQRVGAILMNLDIGGVLLPLLDRERRLLARHSHRLAHHRLQSLERGAVGIEVGDAVTVCSGLDRDLRSKRLRPATVML